ncbi:TetR/AcrR family transcriptional regulator [Rhodanobacter glycinis]|uniref:TetR/AcrR family transcriptional regulator n=1 Tax=Rhodanobacter glycinis TaxID=582702 RepID=A0A5B9DYF5_9GAMM|nr:TetR/AcrR family transcriptional regulator [Rhodanobacter glycinis]
MATQKTLIKAALKVLETRGESQFSTRTVCALANVTAPTLYHHFGSADGLLSAAITEAFEQFLAAKKAATQSLDPVVALVEGWDDYVRFAAERPRIYAAMMARVLHGANIPAAGQAYAQLLEKIGAIQAVGRLAVSEEAAAQLVWASANAASLLYVTASLEVAVQMQTPDPAVVVGLRDGAMRLILSPKRKKK